MHHTWPTVHTSIASSSSSLVKAVVVSSGVGLLNIAGMPLSQIQGSVCGATTEPFKMMKNPKLANTEQ